jgi:hypothetical protein
VLLHDASHLGRQSTAGGFAQRVYGELDWHRIHAIRRAPNGISSYRVSYQVNGGFIRWLDDVTMTSATFNASSLGIPNGALVGFRSQALDNFGNRTPAGNATASTTINTVNPTVVMNSLPTWTTSSTFNVSWTGNTQGGPPITSYNFDVSVNGGNWQRLLSNTPQTSFQYRGKRDFQFRVRPATTAEHLLGRGVGHQHDP